jgi:hypothetical protein
MAQTTIIALRRFAASSASASQISNPLMAAIELWRALTNDLFDRYRPEKHYMRGPGPKWHEKQDQKYPPGTGAIETRVRRHWKGGTFFGT